MLETPSFFLGESSLTRLATYDVAGREVDVLVDGRLRAGGHRVTWRAGAAAPGVYFFRLTAGLLETQRKAIRLE